jgi:hypothetical protein
VVDILTAVVPGTTTSASTQFLDANNNPIASNNPATWALNTNEGLTIISGSASQDDFDPSIWHATLAIPDELPILPYGQLYRLIWTLTATNGANWNNTDSIAAQAPDEPPDQPLGLVIVNDIAMDDTLLVPVALGSYQHSVLDNEGNIVWQGSVNTAPSPLVYEGGFAYTDTIPAQNLYERGNPYWIRWLYNVEGYPSHITQYPLWLMVPRAWGHIAELKSQLDKIRDQDIDANLRWSDAELMQHLYTGLNHVNASPPHHTNWGLDNSPHILDIAIRKAAQLSAIEARYLAEGMTAFEFTGQSTNLTIDRTQYLSAVMGDLTSWLEANLANYKRNAIRRGPGQLHVTLGPAAIGGMMGGKLGMPPYFPGQGRPPLLDWRKRGGWT